MTPSSVITIDIMSRGTAGEYMGWRDGRRRVVLEKKFKHFSYLQYERGNNTNICFLHNSINMPFSEENRVHGTLFEA